MDVTLVYSPSGGQAQRRAGETPTARSIFESVAFERQMDHSVKPQSYEDESIAQSRPEHAKIVRHLGVHTLTCEHHAPRLQLRASRGVWEPAIALQLHDSEGYVRVSSREYPLHELMPAVGTAHSISLRLVAVTRMVSSHRVSLPVFSRRVLQVAASGVPPPCNDDQSIRLIG